MPSVITNLDETSRNVIEKEKVKFPIITNVIPEGTRIGKGFNVQPNKESAIAINGKFFTNKSVILFDNEPLTTTFGDETYLTASVPTRLLNKVSNVDINVLNDNIYKSNRIIFMISDRNFRDKIESSYLFNILYKIKNRSKIKKDKNEKLNLLEISEKKMVLGSTPRFMIIDPTNKCNCRCTICYRLYTDFEIIDLSINNFNKLKSFLKNALDVNLMGTGESFLNKNLFEMARVCKKYGTSTFLSSNGMLINSNLKIIKYINNLNISFDGGTKETFEKIRVGAKFEKVIENIKSINALKIKPFVRLDVRVSKQNLEELSEIVKIAKELKIKEVYFMPVYPMVESMHSIILSGEDNPRFKQIKEEVNNLGKDLGVLCFFGFSLEESNEDKSLPKQNPNVYCTAPWRMIYVQSNGMVRPCCVLDMHMGDLNESSIEKIWNNQTYQSLRASMIGLEDLNDFCKKCSDVQRFL